jgi:hypothetical protein
VIDAATRQPLPGATVWAETAWLDEESVEDWTRADERGGFVLRGVEVDAVQIDAPRAFVSRASC